MRIICIYRERDEVKIVRNHREIQREKEMEDESRERKRIEKKAREKEAGYQERLRNWESRERRKAKDYEKVSEFNFLFPKQIEFKM